MRVSDILRGKESSGVETIDPSEKLSRAATILSGKRIGTLVVTSTENTPIGILSERDIVREVGRVGGDCLSQSVDTIMTKRVITCGPHDTAEDVLNTMTEGRFRHMPVMEGEDMIGVVSLGDVVKAQLKELAREKDALTDMIMGHG